MIDYVQNSIKIYDDNVLNLDAERLFREAEDNFFYFNKSRKAIIKLKSALALAPCHIKSMKLIGDIYFSIGKMQRAFDFYSQAAALKSEDSTILASLASSCEALGNFSNALAFVDLAFDNLTTVDSRLYAPLSELKVSLLIKLQKYSEAKKFLDNAKKRLSFDDAGKIATTTQDVLSKKLSLKERMENLNIKVV